MKWGVSESHLRWVSTPKFFLHGLSMPLRKISADEFARRLRSSTNETDKRYAFFLGAGCSISSGIPAAGSLVVDEWLPQLRALRSPNAPDLLLWASQEIPNFDPSAASASYGAVIERLFLNPEERQREIERLCDHKFPGFGYAILANLVTLGNGHFNVVLTTNFDDLLEDAMIYFAGERPLVIRHESLARFIRPTRTRPVVVKLHGDHRLAPKNTTQETESLNAEVESTVRTVLHDRGIIFMGYSGNDAGISAMLSALPEHSLPFGVYWVNGAEPNCTLRPWLDQQNAVWIDTYDFDEVMLLIQDAFDLDHPKISVHERAFEAYQRTFELLSARLVSLPASLVSLPASISGSAVSSGQAVDAHSHQLALAAGKTLSVDGAASLIAANSQLEPDSATIRMLAERWVDYTLLATAFAEDPALAMLDFDEIEQKQRDGDVIASLLKSVVQVDTEISDAELARVWQEQGPGVEVHARHILLKVGADATPSHRNAVKRLGESIRRQAANGADFESLARRYSEDTSREDGGNLGFFSRGQMVPEFEKAAFALRDGQISSLVETPFGFHIIAVVARRQRELGNEKEQFRRFVVQRRQQVGAKEFTDALRKASHVRVKASASQQVREIARNPGDMLRISAAERALATFRGGKFTAGQLQEELAAASPDVQTELSTASDSRIKAILRQQVTKYLLLAEASRRGIRVTEQELLAMREVTRASLQNAVKLSGVGEHGALGGTAGISAIERRVHESLQQAIAGDRQMPALGIVGTQLRRLYGGVINDVAIQEVADKILRIRAANPGRTRLAAPPRSAGLDH